MLLSLYLSLSPSAIIRDSILLWGNKLYKILHNLPSGTYFPLDAISCSNIYNNMITATLAKSGGRRNIRYQRGVDRNGRIFERLAFSLSKYSASKFSLGSKNQCSGTMITNMGNQFSPLSCFLFWLLLFPSLTYSN